MVRAFVAGCLAMGGAELPAWAVSTAEGEKALPPWTPGELDIHHIDTGRGNADRKSVV